MHSSNMFQHTHNKTNILLFRKKPTDIEKQEYFVDTCCWSGFFGMFGPNLVLLAIGRSEEVGSQVVIDIRGRHMASNL